MKKNNISFIIPCWGDRHEFEKCFMDNLKNIGSNVAEIIIGTDNQTAISIKSILKKTISSFSDNALPSIRLIVVFGKVNKSLILNICYKISRSKNILFCDCDVIIPLDTLRKMYNHSENGDIAYIEKVHNIDIDNTIIDKNMSTISSIKNLIKITANNGASVTVEKNAIFPSESARSGPGIIAINREFFKIADGYNSKLEGYGWEDIDLMIRVGLVSHAQIKPTGIAHERRNIPDRKTLDRRLLSDSRNYQNCLANYCIGETKGTFTYDSTNTKYETFNYIQG